VVAAIQAARLPDLRLRYADPIEKALSQIMPILPTGSIANRALGLLWLSGDSVVGRWPIVEIHAHTRGIFLN
jgi:hypothetical protein